MLPGLRSNLGVKASIPSSNAVPQVQGLLLPFLRWKGALRC